MSLEKTLNSQSSFATFLVFFFFLAYFRDDLDPERSLCRHHIVSSLSSLTSNVCVENPSTRHPSPLSSGLLHLQRTPRSRCPRMKPQRAPCHQRRSLSSLSLWKTPSRKEVRPTRWPPAASSLLRTVRAPHAHPPRWFQIGRHPGRRPARSS